MTTTTPWNYVYLSPHLDDAVLSCGGTIYAQTAAGGHAAVVTFFTASPVDETATPFSLELKVRWGNVTDSVAMRRTEDLAAVAELGARAVHLDFLDCVYRHDPLTAAPYYVTRDDIFGDVHPAEAEWPPLGLAALQAAVEFTPGTVIYAPLTVGHHVDHILVHGVARALQGAGYDVRYYTDYPYARDTAKIAEALARCGHPAARAEYVPFGDAAMEAKVAAVGCYASQLSTFWPDQATMRAALQQFARVGGGEGYAEAYWRLPAPGA